MNQETYNNLIVKQLSEGLTIEEAELLNSWLKEDPSHGATKERLTKAWNQADLYKKDIKVNEAEAWKKVAGRLKKETKLVPLWKRPWVAAASVVLLLGMSWILFQNQEPTFLEYATSVGEKRLINLSDGSIVTLNENSNLTFSDKPQARLVSLKGEAFFEVQHEPSRPFSVENRKTKTTVLGTVFNVNGSGKEETVVSLLEGKIAFEADGVEQVVLAPGESVNYNLGSKTLKKSSSKNENETAWKTKQLKFENEKITKVIQTIEAYFDKSIKLILDKEECRFTGTFDNPKYAEIIEVLKFTYDLEYKAGKTTDQIQIKSCK